MKKIALLFTIMLLPMVASAEIIEIGGIYYNLVAKAKAAEVTENPNEYTGSVVIPATVNYNGVEYKVMRILEKAFSGCKDLTSVTIPSTVTKIGNNAFWYSGITSITIPEGVTNIEDKTFYCCENLASVTIPDGVTSIGNYAFSFCYNLTSLTLPNSVKSIGYGAFNSCSSLSSIMIPNGLTSIESYTFSDCSSLTSIEIPNSVTSIGGYAFGFCNSLSSITIPSSVTHITQKTFEGCRGLTSITFLGSSEMSIERSVFKDCEALTAVHISDLSSWCKMSFEDIYSNPLYYARHLYVGEEEIKDLVIPNNVTSIGEYAFPNCSNLTSVLIPDNVTRIGGYAFQGCLGLSSFTIPNSVTSIGKYAFYECSGLNSITISNSLTNIEEGTFNGCSGLTSVTFPNSVTSIGLWAFSRCYGLTSVTIPNSVTSIGYGAFYECSSLSSITLGSGVKFIDDQAFGSCEELMDVYSWATEVSGASKDAFKGSYIEYATLHVPTESMNAYRNVAPWKDFEAIVPIETQMAYRPFVEEGKVWKLGGKGSGNPVQLVEYYYFNGDTIIDGKTCKQMMCQRYVNPDYPDYDIISQYPSLSYEGAWYEEDKKVYFYNTTNKQFQMKYDFSLGDNEGLWINNNHYVIGPKQTGGLDGFKGVYRDVMWYDEEATHHNTTWLEGVGSIEGPIHNVYLGEEYYALFLMSCTVGDEVIYLNDEYEDGATPEGARKSRFDFTHTIKIKPKAPIKREKSDACISSSEREVARPKVKAPMKRSEADQSVYGEYNDLQLGINLNPLDEAYQVRITNESDQVVYGKTVNAGSIVALSIDISAYAKGRYTVTVENSREAFTGEFETMATGISDAAQLNDKEKMINDKHIYNLLGRRLQGKPSKGLYIQGGKKYLVK